MKFTVGRPVVEGTASRSINSAEAARGDPLAEALFAIPGVIGLFMVADFITVLKSESANWDNLVPAVLTRIAESYR